MSTTPSPATAVQIRSHAEPACHAPFISLFLDQRGYVRSCAANHEWVLGQVGHEHLSDIWRGEAAEKLRDALSRGDYGLGCSVCRWQSEENSTDGAFARMFDRFPIPSESPYWPVQMEFAMGNACNLECIMCNGEQSSAIRHHREHLPALPSPYGPAFFDDLAQFLPHLQLAKFLGGEPFLVRDHFKVWDLMIDSAVVVPCHITTNGTQWNDRVARVLDHLPCSVTISFDGITPATVEAIRLGTELRVLLRNLDRFCAYADARGTSVTLTFALMRQNWHEFGDFLRFADDRDLQVYVNTVFSPIKYSLYQLPADELAGIIASLELQDHEAVRALGKNRAVWEDQLERLRARHRALVEAHHPARPHDGPVVVDWDVPEDISFADEVAALEAWSEGGVVSPFRMNDKRIVTWARDREHFLEAPIDPVGMGIDELLVILESLYGRQIARVPRQDRAGAREWQLTFEDAARVVEVRIVAGPERDGAGDIESVPGIFASRTIQG